MKGWCEALGGRILRSKVGRSWGVDLMDERLRAISVDDVGYGDSLFHPMDRKR
jgi:hypothetical protein